jgi:rubrerythrin
MTDNTAKANGGTTVSRSYRELITSVTDNKPAPSSEEIIERLRSKLKKYGEQG